MCIAGSMVTKDRVDRSAVAKDQEDRSTVENDQNDRNDWSVVPTKDQEYQSTTTKDREDRKWCKGSKIEVLLQRIKRLKCCYEGSKDWSVAAKGSSDRVMQKMKTLKSSFFSYWLWKLPMTYRCITSILLKILSLCSPIVYDDVVSIITFSLRGSVEIL